MSVVTSEMTPKEREPAHACACGGASQEGCTCGTHQAGECTCGGAGGCTCGTHPAGLDVSAETPSAAQLPASAAPAAAASDRLVTASALQAEGGGPTVPPSRGAYAPVAERPLSEVSLAQAEERAPWDPYVYALGILGYDFGSDARRDSFKQLMAPVTVEGGTVVPANPYDTRQMVDHLRANPSEAQALIWTLNLEMTPIYAIEPVGPYAASVYDLLIRLLAGEVAGEDEDEFIERVSIPGRLTDRHAKLFSGQNVTVVETEQTRGLYGWQINKLIPRATEATEQIAGAQDSDAVANALREFLTRVYYDLRNLGNTSHDRALNFAATNAFQAAHTFATAVAAGMALDTIDVEKSPFCRMDSDCWDVKLRFFDPENNQRARKVFRFTIDVSDLLPVTLGDVRSWSEAG
jgi:cyanobactin maturation PatA/PatG family protease